MKKYYITVSHLKYENTDEFATIEEARDFAVAKRKQLAQDMGVDLFDLWFEVEEVMSDED